MMPLLCMGTDQTTENLQEGETARAYSQGVSMRTIFLSYAVMPYSHRPWP